MTLKEKADLAYRLSMGAFLAQIILLILATLWLVPSHKSPNLTICILSLTPLLILTPWLVKKNVRAFIWLCFIVLGYFLNTVQNCFISQYGILPFFELAAIVCLFISAMLFARWQSQWQRLGG